MDLDEVTEEGAQSGAGPVAVLDAVVRDYRRGPTVGPISLSVGPGVCFGLVGANGAGKTTLMRCLLGLDEPTSGTVHLFGERVRPGRPPKRTSGMIEEPQFFGWLNARENLAAVCPNGDALQRVDETLAMVGLGDSRERPVNRFSQGMRQRLGLARVLVVRPQLLVLDEPTNGLDPVGIKWLRGLVRELVTEGRSVLLSSHLLHEVQACADQFLMIDRGEVIADGAVTEIEKFGSLEDLYFNAVAKR